MLINGQWNPDQNINREGKGQVLSTDLNTLGASDQKVNISTSPSKVYWFTHGK